MYELFEGDNWNKTLNMAESLLKTDAFETISPDILCRALHPTSKAINLYSETEDFQSFLLNPDEALLAEPIHSNTRPTGGFLGAKSISDLRQLNVYNAPGKNDSFDDFANSIPMGHYLTVTTTGASNISNSEDRFFIAVNAAISAYHNFSPVVLPDIVAGQAEGVETNAVYQTSRLPAVLKNWHRKYVCEYQKECSEDFVFDTALAFSNEVDFDEQYKNAFGSEPQTWLKSE